MILKIKYALYTRLFRLLCSRSFLVFGEKSNIIFPLNINGKKNISIGNNVNIAYKAWLAAVPLTGNEKCELIIGDGSCIGNFNHIYATKSIVIGKNVLTADKVYISDNLHGYEDVTMPIVKQPIKQIGTVVIGEGTWLGENVCVIGVKIGRNCVIGANSVVTKDIPDYCVVVGAPAKIIKRYCFKGNKWLKTDKQGNFIKEALK
jgi:carbonic anhydrase/acetyltransferase-like protein (isoleucine patch superfamily)